MVIIAILCMPAVVIFDYFTKNTLKKRIAIVIQTSQSTLNPNIFGLDLHVGFKGWYNNSSNCILAEPLLEQWPIAPTIG